MEESGAGHLFNAIKERTSKMFERVMEKEVTYVKKILYLVKTWDVFTKEKSMIRYRMLIQKDVKAKVA